MFDYDHVSISYGTLTGFIAPDEEDVSCLARDSNGEHTLYHPEKRTCKGVTLEIPESIRGIGDGALENCSALIGITIPESVTSIGASAFRGCNNLQEITFPSQLKEIGKEAFADCSGLTKIHVPDSVASIGESAFEGCRNLEEIRLPDGLSRQVKRIFGGNAEGMFYDVRSGNLKVNDRLASALTGIIKGKWNEAAKKLIDAEDCEKMKQYLALWKDRPVDIDRLDEAIAQSQRRKKTDMTALLMEYKRQHYSPEQQESRRQREAERALGLRAPTVADWQKVFTYRTEEDGLVIRQYKGKEAVIEVPALIGRKPVIAIEQWRPKRYRDNQEKPYRIVLPEGLLQIRKYAFLNCTRLTDIILPKTLEEIGEGAFKGCASLQQVVLPEGITCIPRGALFSCTALTSVTIPESVQEIWWEAFGDCTSLKELNLPGNVRNIQKSYWYCANYEEIEVRVPQGSLTEETVKKNHISYHPV